MHPDSLFALLFLCLLAALTLWGGVPAAVFHFYLAASCATFACHLFDKRAARGNRRRVSERTLQLMGLACGWPGGIAGQRLARHKTLKGGFLLVFRAGVLLNCGALVFLGYIRGWWPRLL